MNSSRSGFTLLELLVSVGILALLTVLLYGGLRAGIRNAGRESASSDQTARIVAVQNLLRGQLAGAKPIVIISGRHREAEFSGGPTDLRFVSEAPESVSFGGLQALTLRLVRGSNDAGALVALWRPFRKTSATQSPVRTILFDHVKRISFRYFGPENPHNLPRWHEMWHDAPYLPFLVRLSVALSNGRRVPDLTVALRLSTTTLEQRENRARF